jgi:hypothetical protein
MKTMIRGCGRFALTLATMGFLVTLSLFLMASYMLTWPLLRTSPRERRLRASAELASAVMGAIQAFAPTGDNEDG